MVQPVIRALGGLVSGAVPQAPSSEGRLIVLCGQAGGASQESWLGQHSTFNCLMVAWKLQ